MKGRWGKNHFINAKIMNKKRLWLMLAVACGLSLLLPVNGLKAAANTTTLAADTIIHFANGGTNGMDIVVAAASTVESFTLTDEVGNTKLVFELDTGSALHLKSNGRKNFEDSPNVASTDCTSSSSYSTYDYTATSDDYTLTITFTETDNCPTSSGSPGGGGGGGGGDTTAPTISSIEATAKDTEATIVWTTSEASISWVVYGGTTAYGNEAKTAVYKTAHSTTLSGLTPVTTYHYQIKAQDSSGNASYYGDKTFTTLATSTTPTPPPTTPAPSASTPTVTTPESSVPSANLDMKLAKRLTGRLLLRVERGGEIWYVDTKEYKRYQVTFANALFVFQKLSLGITDANLAKIPVNGSSETGNVALRNRLKGKLLLQVQKGGAIWYVDTKGYRHSVTWANLMDLFRKLALGITNANLDKIPAGSL